MTSPPAGRTSQVAALFDLLSDSYDDVGVPFFYVIARDLLKAMPPRAGERWLDVGCGRGAVLLEVAQHVRPAEAVGTDLSPGMLERCRQAAERAGLDNVRLVVDDAQALVAKAGWAGVRTVRGEVAVRLVTPQRREAFSMSTGQRGMWMSVPEPERGAVRERAYALLAEHADADGTVT